MYRIYVNKQGIYIVTRDGKFPDKLTNILPGVLVFGRLYVIGC